MRQKSRCIIGVKGMHVSAFDGFSQKSFFDRIRTQLVLWLHWSLCKSVKRTKTIWRQIDLSTNDCLARQTGPLMLCGRVSARLVASVLQNNSNIKLAVSSSAPPWWQIRSSQERAVFGIARRLLCLVWKIFGCCLVGNLVAPLLNGLNDLKIWNYENTK